MLFCPKCGAIMKPSKQRGVLECSGCGFKVKPQGQIKVTSTIKKTSKRVEVIDKEPKVLPKTKEECPKCGNTEAYYWLQQTRAADEAATKFLKCTKCGHVWRDYN